MTSDKDRNGNTTSYGFDGSGHPASITSSRGPSAGRTATVTATSGRITQIAQTSGSLSRSVSFGYTAGGNLNTVTDADGTVTTFDNAIEGSTGPVSDTGFVTHISNYHRTTWLSPDSGDRIITVSQTNPTSDGGAGEAFTRLKFNTSTQTLVADPDNASGSVSTVPHTTYNLDSTTSKLVSSTTDPDGNSRSATYTSLNQVASTTPAAGGSTTFTYGSNSGESLTKVAFPGGAGDIAAYGNSGANAYLPSSTTDDAGNSLTNTFDSNGNQTGSQQGASGPTAKVTYNSDGTAATSASPGAGTGVTTNYGYDSDHDLHTVTAPSGTSPGVRTYTWDGFGRLASATDGAGDTITYTYDNLDRITHVAYSDGTPSVNYTYDPNGNLTIEADGSETTTDTYDDLGHLLTTVNTANGNTVTYTYDLAGALASTVDGNGTTTYGYDADHQLTSMTYPDPAGTQTTLFANDANGRRTDVWMQSNSTHTTWAAHEQYTYDSPGRITAALGQDGPATSPSNAVNETLCYSAGSAAPTCPTTATADRTNIQWTRDTVSGETDTYTYDTSNRLTKDVVTGGTNPRTYTYGYDAAGNRTSSSVTGTNASSQTLTYNNDNQITSSGYSYDAAGNQTTNPTRTATFNAAGQLTGAKVGTAQISYTWAGTNEDELLSQTNPQHNAYTYTYGRPDKNGLPELDSIKINTNTGYVLHDPAGTPVMLMTNTGKNCLYLYDGTGNPVALSTSLSVTALALQYDPYGAETRIDSNGTNGPSTTNPYGFGLGVVDPDTHEVRYGQRYYNPASGTWAQQDTLNAPLDATDANRYEFSGDNPNNQTDPTGRDITCDLNPDNDFCLTTGGETSDDGFWCVISTAAFILTTPTTLSPIVGFADAVSGSSVIRDCF